MRNSLKQALWTFFVGLLLVGQSAQSQDVDTVVLGESDSHIDGGFLETFFFAGIEGTGIANAAIVTPLGQVVPLFPDDPGVFFTEVPFFSVAEREAVFPDGTYQLFLNGVFAGSAFFAVVTPDGLVDISAPEHLSAVPSLTPTFELSNSCTNCTELMELFVVQVNNDLIEQGAEVLPNTTSFSFPGALSSQQLHLFEASATRVTFQDIMGTDFLSVSDKTNGILVAPGATGAWTGICGDPNGNLILEAPEILRVRESLANPTGVPLTPLELSRCPVIGDPSCDIRQVAVMLRTHEDVQSEPGFSPVCSAAPPSVVGMYTGTITESRSGCVDPSDNGQTVADIDIDITSQDNFGVFEGRADIDVLGFASDVFIRGEIRSNGTLAGQTLSTLTEFGAFDGIVLTDFTGTLVGNALNVNAIGADLVGDTCALTELIAATR